jgi:hypothetical protein
MTGTRQDVHAPGYEWCRHSMSPHHVPAGEGRVLFGGPGVAPEHRYSSSLLNVSGMSYGALSDNAITALNTAARLGSFSHNTGEGGVSRFHLAPGGDIVWVRACALPQLAYVRVLCCVWLMNGRTHANGTEHRQRLLRLPHRGGALGAMLIRVLLERMLLTHAADAACAALCHCRARSARSASWPPPPLPRSR